MPLSFDWPFPEKPSIFYKVASTVTIGLVGSISKIWMSEWRIEYDEKKGIECIYSFLEYLTSVRIENG